jgi:predicted transcriptional regulator
MAWLLLTLGGLLLAGSAGGHGTGAEGALLDLSGTAYPIPGVTERPDLLPNDPFAAITVGTAVLSLLLTALLALGTKHVDRTNVLEHNTRRQMYEFLWQAGSAHLRKIATALDLSTTNATSHLDKLVKAGLVGEMKVNGFRMYYPRGAGRVMRDQCAVAAQVQSDNARAVVDYVARNPGSHQRQIARALAVNHGTARWHLSRLADAGILTAARSGRVTRYQISDQARTLMQEAPATVMTQELARARTIDAARAA